MVLQLAYISGNAVALAVLSPTISFVLFFAIVILVWVFAIVRQTLGMSVLSALSWFSLMFALFIVGDLTSGLTLGMAIFSCMLGVVMIVVAIFQAFESLRRAAEEKQRRFQEEIM